MGSFIEPLEARIAPAALHGQVLTYTDIDGDHVTISFAKGNVTATNFTFSTGSVDGTVNTPQQLTTLDLQNQPDGVSATATVVRAAGGDGRVAIGNINATGVNLGSIVIPGDLETIECGADNSAVIPAIKTLSVYSMGVYSTQASGNSLLSSIKGPVGKLSIKDDLVDEEIAIANTSGIPAITVGSLFIGGSIIGSGGRAGLNVAGNILSATVEGSIVGLSAGDSGDLTAEGNILSVHIGGSIVGGPGGLSGALTADAFGSISIGHDLIGGTGAASGCILAGTGAIGSLTIGGSVVGGSNTEQTTIDGNSIDGQISAFGSIGPVKIGGNVLGGSGEYSGKIESLGAIGPVTIGGSLVGGSTNQTGEIAADGGAGGGNGSIGSVSIGHDLIGGSVGASGTLSDAGEIYATGNIGFITIGGDFAAGGAAGGTLDFSSASIRCSGAIGAVKIGGSMLGNTAGTVTILAVGQETLPVHAHIDTAISSLTVGGTVRYAEILAGFNFDKTPANVESSIGPVKVRQDWIASDLVAGAQDTTSDGWGSGDSVQVSSNLIAQIASISIGGAVAGAATAHNYGFVAQQINSFVYAGQPLALKPGPSNDNIFFPLTDNVFVEEVG